jgi:hypothetical protein
MHLEVTEKDITNQIGEDHWRAFINDVCIRIFSKEKIKSLKEGEEIYSIGIVELGHGFYLHFEIISRKAPNGSFDYGFTKLVMTDNIDSILDRVNRGKAVMKIYK